MFELGCDLSLCVSQELSLRQKLKLKLKQKIKKMFYDVNCYIGAHELNILANRIMDINENYTDSFEPYEVGAINGVFIIKNKTEQIALNIPESDSWCRLELMLDSNTKPIETKKFIWSKKFLYMFEDMGIPYDRIYNYQWLIENMNRNHIFYGIIIREVKRRNCVL